MILAGIDEAGYGPLLGPLVVGCCAFEIPDVGCEDAPPCLWKRLRRHVSRTRSRNGRRLHVNDSKLVYSPSIGLRELERSVLAVAFASAGGMDDLDALLEFVAPGSVREAGDFDWYRSDLTDRFPLEQEAVAIRMFANALRLDMERAATRCVHLQARVVFERRLNTMIHATRNKASALFSIAASHLEDLLRTHGRAGLVIICDRQGGREHYGSLLRLMFPDWSLEIDREEDGCSEYRLIQDGHTVRLIFREKAEVGCMPVALASMLSKYLREAMMRRFNAFWRLHQPDVAPTAGYYGDGTRFLNDIAETRRRLGIADEHLVRCR